MDSNKVIIMEVKDDYAIVMTSDFEFIKIKKKKLTVIVRNITFHKSFILTFFKLFNGAIVVVIYNFLHNTFCFLYRYSDSASLNVITGMP